MGGTPLPPFTDKIFGKKGVTDLGGTPPPPFTDKIGKVVFEVLPNIIRVQKLQGMSVSPFNL